jgi:hypothetical protein
MSLYVTEFDGWGAIRGREVEMPAEPAIRNSVMSSGSSAAATSLAFSSGTFVVRLTCDVASYCLFGSSTASTGTQTSTMCERIAPNAAAEYRSVLPYSTLIAFST